MHWPARNRLRVSVMMSPVIECGPFSSNPRYPHGAIRARVPPRPFERDRARERQVRTGNCRGKRGPRNAPSRFRLEGTRSPRFVRPDARPARMKRKDPES
ncbi:hypothetical protein A8E81_16085 [Burkholderia cenocepacia]|nr:hypothetical protein A8E75_07525 [Burkholderia cenocepacia]ONV15661.1 hypothetical protein A8E74_29730 [Burkholderia cenocepacia]ONV32681.1 hypothetical protein A8E78_13055 [Burkholderia cenocepacia]ONV37149.1 hypothetical protein A8E77_08925 [Burkholderia cenocepacia]ONV43708.1 hypothetical protein A8E82_10915 [Burkholderia cenocepacia]